MQCSVLVLILMSLLVLKGTEARGLSRGKRVHSSEAQSEMQTGTERKNGRATQPALALTVKERKRAPFNSAYNIVLKQAAGFQQPWSREGDETFRHRIMISPWIDVPGSIEGAPAFQIL